MSSYFYAIVALLGGAIGVSLTAWYSRLSTKAARNQRQKDVYHTLKAELTTLERHCAATIENIDSRRDYLEIVAFRKAKYGNEGLLSFDVKDAHILNTNLCVDIMRLSLFARNNEIELDEIISLLRDGALPDDLHERLRQEVLWRMHATSEIALAISVRIDKHVADPSSYDEATLNHYDMLRDRQRRTALRSPVPVQK